MHYMKHEQAPKPIQVIVKVASTNSRGLTEITNPKTGQKAFVDIKKFR